MISKAFIFGEKESPTVRAGGLNYIPKNGQ